MKNSIQKLSLVLTLLMFFSVSHASITHFETGTDQSGHFYISEKTKKTLTAPVSPCSLFGIGSKAIPGDFSDNPEACWLIGDWGSCSNGCGEGVMKKSVQCVDLAGEDSSKCIDLSRPDISLKCSDNSRCDYVWKTDEWSPCSSTCGEGQTTRNIWCESIAGNSVEDLFCSSGNRPTESATCSDFSECGYEWSYGEWGACQGEAWTETRTRDAACMNHLGEIVSDNLCTEEKIDSEPCAGESLPSYASCYEVYSLGETIDGYYKVGGHKTYCDMANGGWTLIARAPANSVEFRYDGSAWNDIPFGTVEGSGSYLSPFWSSLNTSEINLRLDGLANIIASSAQSAPFSQLRTSGTLYQGSYKMTQGSRKLNCAWSQTVYYRFAYVVWPNTCTQLQQYYGLGMKSPQRKYWEGSAWNSLYQSASGRLKDGADGHDSAYQHSFTLWVK